MSGVKVIDKEIVANNTLKSDNTKECKKEVKILGYTIWRLMLYFIIYSVIGYFIETTYGLLTKGVLESRKSFLYGPFCAIYGVGAVIMILGLQYFKKNNYTLFFGGFLIGSIVEYVVSLVGEIILHIKWWDYSSMPFNIEGRVCVFFSLFWGALAIYLITHINPKVDKLIDKIPNNYLKIVSVSGVIIMFIDCIITGFALRMFFTRLVKDYNLELQNTTEYFFEYSEMYDNNETVRKIVDKYFNNEKILKTFPNIKVTSKDGQIIYVCDILSDIQPYYFRVFTPRIMKNNEQTLFTKNSI